ncbi:UDP-N-acetylenolpyruvoylglucosamine reductase [Sphingomonas paucimobilis]|nr:UDP-N-acetylenolpyruvoylglucosamine reductase [Sphingomonas paucimobilis]
METDISRSTPDALLELRHLLPDQVSLGASLADVSRWRVGGPADAIVTPRCRADLETALVFLRDHGIRYTVVGGGSNLLFDDEGYRGAVVRIGRAFGGFEHRGNGVIHAGAGIWVPSFVRRLISAGLQGAEHAIGIPGTLGGLIVMNGGSERRGIGEIITSVDVLGTDGQVRRLGREELGFSYRRSVLQGRGEIVLSATFQLENGDRAALRHRAIGTLASRRAKFPAVRQNCGSVFVSDPTLYSLIGPPGLAIERAGLKGMRRGDAQISPDHANFIVNNGHAGSADVLCLISTARRKVEALTGIAMLAEVRYLDPFGQSQPAHEVCDDYFQQEREHG